MRYIRHFFSVILYWFIKFTLKPSLRLIGYKQTLVGTCTVLAPPEQMAAIQQGFILLKALDCKMFEKLTTVQRRVFWYHKNSYLRCREYSTITLNFLLWEEEGVVACLVQTAMELNQQKVYEWLTQHSFSVRLCEQFKTVAE